MNSGRFKILVAALTLCALAVIARATQIAVIEHDSWEKRARRQQQRTLEVPTLRASVRSSEGYVLAASLDRMAIQVDTAALEYPRLFAAAAAPLVGSPEQELASRLMTGQRAVWLAKETTSEVAEAVRRLAPDAVVLVPDSERIYPSGTLAAAVLGFVGREELKIVGRAGLEHRYNELLAGEPDRYLAVRDAVQRQVQLKRLTRGRTGYDLELTLSARLQALCERELEKARLTQGASAGSAVILDVSSGDVLALASVPSYDPSRPGDVAPERWRLRPVQDAFEPGSTAKPFVAAAALSFGVVQPGEKFDCTHRGISVAGHWIRDHAEPGFYDLDAIIAHSANAGIITVAHRLEQDLLWHTFHCFGFGHRTGVEFPAEASGLLHSTSSWSKMSPSGLALGQELTASPLQVAAAYATIANGGWLCRPRLVRQATNRHESIVPADHSPVRVLDESIATRVCSMLEQVVADGTGELARIPGFRVAGKTGTAQRTFLGAFDNEHHVAWFAGFLPLPKPKIVIVVEIEDPPGDFWASTAAAPIFARIAEGAANLLSIPPSVQLVGQEADSLTASRPAPLTSGAST
ncbi:MAG: penicillin-binding protein 2 [bacterium]|nr:penicillin-binding protein 2 [bacterium]